MFTIGGAWTVLVLVLLGFAWRGPRCLRGVGGCYLWVLPTSPNRMVKPRYIFLLVQLAELVIRRSCLLFNCIKANYAWKRWRQLSSTTTYHLPSILLWKSQALWEFWITLLSPSGDLGISLVWHNLSPPHRNFSVRLLKSSSKWTKLSMMGPQLFSGWYIRWF